MCIKSSEERIAVVRLWQKTLIIQARHGLQPRLNGEKCARKMPYICISVLYNGTVFREIEWGWLEEVNVYATEKK